MTEIHLPDRQEASRESKSLWAAAVVILGVVFTPVLVAWMFMLLRS
jgi:hypothetical protein